MKKCWSTLWIIIKANICQNISIYDPISLLELCAIYNLRALLSNTATSTKNSYIHMVLVIQSLLIYYLPCQVYLPDKPSFTQQAVLVYIVVDTFVFIYLIRIYGNGEGLVPTNTITRLIMLSRNIMHRNRGSNSNFDKAIFVSTMRKG